MTTRSYAAIKPGSVDADTSFAVIDAPTPVPAGHDLLVEVRAVSVNPVDVKVRAGFDASDGPKVLGFDAAGVVVATGPDVTSRAVGDEVYYAGSIGRSGTNTEHHLVDEHIVGRKPTTLTFAEAAALPLTTITAWEALFEVLGIEEHSTGTLLIIGGAGGTGSMVTQLARARTGLTVIATASRRESADWSRSMGAHHVVDRHHLIDEVRALAPDGIDYVFSAFSDGNVETYAELLCVQGKVVAIDDPDGLDASPLKSKSQSWSWEFMFAKPLHQPENPSQRQLLDTVADLVDAGSVRTTLSRTLTPIDTNTLREAHRLVESSATIGKIVVSRE